MARRRPAQATIPSRRLILDSGAVIALARGDVRARAVLTRALEIGVDVRIPVAVLAETLRGGPRDAPVHRVRNAVDVFPTDERIARLAGALLGRTGGSNTVDALVAAEAVVAAGDVLTSDVDDLRALLPAHAPGSVIGL
ncbi:MAG TPA: PIN domain-containing protein [Vicinamibacterales bacterium]|nr:PIN domain-containing protein [Vicinamibacterales bacterium]